MLRTENRKLITENKGRDEIFTARCKPAVIRSQEKKWHVIPEQYAASAVVRQPNSF
jgi:hypothetical protein